MGIVRKPVTRFTRTSSPHWLDLTMINQDITRKIIAAAMRIHTKLGPGLLESAYREFMFFDLVREGLNVEKEKIVPIQYAGVKLDHGYRIDLLVDRRVVVELKTV